jgi:hypothetical protein
MPDRTQYPPAPDCPALQDHAWSAGYNKGLLARASNPARMGRSISRTLASPASGPYLVDTRSRYGSIQPALALYHHREGLFRSADQTRRKGIRLWFNSGSSGLDVSSHILAGTRNKLPRTCYVLLVSPIRTSFGNYQVEHVSAPVGHNDDSSDVWRRLQWLDCALARRERQH